MNIEEIMKEAYEYSKPFAKEGKIVDYIEALKDADQSKFGASLIDSNGKVYEVGTVDIYFTIMSIVKIFLYQIALENYEFSEIRSLVGLSGSSKPFNSLLDLQLSKDNKPVNPFINAGALVVSYLIYKKFGDKSIEVVLDKVREMTGNKDLYIDQNVVKVSSVGGQANKAIAYSLQNNNVIGKEVDVLDVLNIYNSACSIMVNTKDLAVASYVLSSGGIDLNVNKLMDSDHARIIRTLMATCGTYDYAGDFAVEVGVPAKSGVGGGIIATTNKGFGLATYGPGLDSRGNSVVGMKMMEYISRRLDLKIY